MRKTKVRLFPSVLYPENRLFFLNGTPLLPAPLSKEEEEECFEAIARGSEEAKNKLITHNLRLVVYIAKKFENSGVPVEDLVSIGTIGLIKAVKTFCPSKNIKLATYASRCVENEILMYLRKIGNMKTEISIDEPLNVDWDGNELLLSDVLSTVEDSVSLGVESEDEIRLLMKCISQLDEREQQIIFMRFGLCGTREYTQKEVATLLGISQSYISRIEKRIILRLKDSINKEYNMA
ncbi:MAG: RNA polymerase sporulation sigma factor SigK [Clostridia bacterium]|nr:RNA polymerase sporulation sigma factor SigK [Clostridia bacterium]MBR3974646.1 RNA polymerase sporulation sigma factor SigK [Clostridia bacterium]